MKTFVAVLLLSGVLLSVGISEILADKGPNMRHSLCGGHPDCQKSCDRPRDNIWCPQACYEGFVCTGDYVRASNDVNAPCILQHNCPPYSRINTSVEEEA